MSTAVTSATPVAEPRSAIPRHHLVITGAGRSGTTFLVELLTHLGLDTGYDPATVSSHVDRDARAGLERDIKGAEAPYVVKSPKFVDCAHEVLRDGRYAIDHVILPVRRLESAAASRRHVDAVARRRLSRLTRLRRTFDALPVAGGLWETGSRRRGAQEAVLAAKLAKLLCDLADSHVPVTLVRFPRSVQDCRYLYEKLAPVVGDVSYERFSHVFRDVAQPSLVHRF